MNGRDGKPFKTREGGVMRLETLLDEINTGMIKKSARTRMSEKKIRKRLPALCRFQPLNTVTFPIRPLRITCLILISSPLLREIQGPYILYTIVRIKSILEKAGKGTAGTLLPPDTPEERNLMLDIGRFGSVVSEAFEELAPHKICAFIYGTANDFNRFYHETKIIAEPDAGRRGSYLHLLGTAEKMLEKSIDILGFSAPDHMRQDGCGKTARLEIFITILNIVQYFNGRGVLPPSVFAIH